MKKQKINQFLLTIFLAIGFVTTQSSAGHSSATLSQSNDHQSFQHFLRSTRPNYLVNRRLGTLQVIYQPTNSYAYLESITRQSHLFEMLADQINNSGLILPSNLSLILAECGTANAFYNPNQRSITICYEFILNAKKDFEKLFKNKSSVETATSALYATIFAFYHELGHALIDILKLPTVGEEEGVVDEFAAIILLDASNISGNDDKFLTEVVFNGAIWFGSQPQGAFWDEHPSGDKRFFNLLCLMYGSNPQKYRPMMSEIVNVIQNEQNVNPEELSRRAKLCEQEYPKKLESWTKLLMPHFSRAQGGWGQSRNNPPYVPPSNNGRNRERIW